MENGGADDLEVKKVYRVLFDKLAATNGHLRVVDESGEDYLYPEEYFVFLDLPPKARRAYSVARRRSAGRSGSPNAAQRRTGRQVSER